MTPTNQSSCVFGLLLLTVLVAFTTADLATVDSGTCSKNAEDNFCPAETLYSLATNLKFQKQLDNFTRKTTKKSQHKAWEEDDDATPADIIKFVLSTIVSALPKEYKGLVNNIVTFVDELVPYASLLGNTLQISDVKDTFKMLLQAYPGFDKKHSKVLLGGISKIGDIAKHIFPVLRRIYSTYVVDKRSPNDAAKAAIVMMMLRFVKKDSSFDVRGLIIHVEKTFKMEGHPSIHAIKHMLEPYFMLNGDIDTKKLTKDIAAFKDRMYDSFMYAMKFFDLDQVMASGLQSILENDPSAVSNVMQTVQNLSEYLSFLP